MPGKVLDNIKETKEDVNPSLFDPSNLIPHDPGKRGEITTDEQRKFLSSHRTTSTKS